MSVTMNQAVAAIKAMLDKRSYKYDFHDDKNIFVVRFNLKTKLGNTRIFIRVRPRSADASLCSNISSHAYVDLKADEGCMAQICEYITRANYGLIMGNFEMDHSDGEIRYKHSVDAWEGVPTDSALSDLINIPLNMLDKYGDGLLAVSMGFLDPKAAIEKAEA